MSDFVHLHLHSEYSLLDGACRIEDIPKAAKALGQSAVAITDHGVMYGVVAFYNACKKEGVKPIIGCEVYVANGSRFDKKRTPDYFNCHLTLLVKNSVGYKNLIHIVSRSFIDGFYMKPRVDEELLISHSEGLICLSGCLSGHLNRALLKGDNEEANAYTEKLISIFGRENLFIEIQDNGVPEQPMLNSALAEIAKKHGLSLVATNDVHYISKKDASSQAILTCIQTNTKISDGRPLGFEKDEFYMKSADEMKALFSKYPEAIENTVKIAEMCSYDFDFGKQHLPTYTPPEGYTASQYLSHLAGEGLEKRINEGSIVFDDEHTRDDYVMRYKYELMIIAKMGYSEYYLIVWDFVSNAKKRGITVGPGRGSGAGSLVAYLIGITDVDSIKYNLLFERFLNPERISMPDFDIDFRDDMRDEAIKYVIEKYGSDRVSQIITFGTMAARAVIRDVGRALGMPYAEVDRVAKAIPHKLGITIKEALDGELGEIYKSSVEVRRLVDTAMALEGMPRHASVHAAGVLITKDSLDSYVPLATSGDTVVAQFDMDTIASLGLLKFDFLAVRYLTVVSNAEREIKKKDPSFNIERIPLDDERTYQLISSGDTDGLFQLESAGMKRMLGMMKPRCLSDIIIAISLYRPGPMESIPLFLENRKNPSKIDYKIPALEGILSETSGVIVYQEQVMQICRKVANFSYGKADVLRRAMSKKKAAAMDAEKGAFMKGAKSNFIDERTASDLFDEMAGFAKYAFNKSHAAAYAVTSYRTAYLKANYPTEYYTAYLSAFRDDSKISSFIADAKKRGVSLLVPDVNLSETFFSAEGANIRFGLLGIKGMGRAICDNISTERKKKPFKSFSDFVERMVGYGINKVQVIALISSGAFDSMGVYRSRLLSVAESKMEAVEEGARKNISGQTDLFSSFTDGEIVIPETVYPDIPELSRRELMNLEKEYMGIYISGSLLDEYSDALASVSFVDMRTFIDYDSDSEDAEEISENKIYTVVGIIRKVVRKNTKNGAVMAFVSLEDKSSEMEIVVFPKIFESASEALLPDAVVAVSGRISIKEDESPKLLATEITRLKTNAERKREEALKAAAASASYVPYNGSVNSVNASALGSNAHESPQRVTDKKAPSKIYIRVPSFTSKEYKRSLAIAEIFAEGGYCEVVFYDESTKEYKKCSIKMCISDFIVSELINICGNGNVIVK